MPSPDITPLVDLRFYDKDPQQLFEEMLVDLQSKLPGWEPRETNVEVMLLESAALASAEVIFAVNRLPGALLQALARLYGITPDAGAPPTTMVQFSVSDPLGMVLKSGLRAVLTLPAGMTPMVFTTTQELTIAPGFTVGSVPAVGDRFTDEANDIAPGGTLALVDSVSKVDSVTLAAEVAGGRDPETDQVWLARAAQRFSRITETLTVARHFVAAALEDPAVIRAKVLDDYNPATAPTPAPGHVTIGVYGAGRALTLVEKQAIEQRLGDQAVANLAVHVVDPILTTVPMTLTIFVSPTFEAQQTAQFVAAALVEWLRPEEWDWSGTVRRNAIMGFVSGLPGVEFVDSITTPASDQNLTGAFALTQPGVITVNVSGSAATYTIAPPV